MCLCVCVNHTLSFPTLLSNINTVLDIFAALLIHEIVFLLLEAVAPKRTRLIFFRIACNITPGND